MTFVHPWAMWIGVIAAGLPVAIHLLTRPRPLRMPLATFRFVREAIRERRARHRLRDAILLTLRTLAILLLAFAVSRPRWSDEAAAADRASQTGTVVRVVVVDVSQSMAATLGGALGPRGELLSGQSPGDGRGRREREGLSVGGDLSGRRRGATRRGD
jgi:hypothetical protein